MEAFAQKMLNEDSDVKGSAEVVAATRTYVSAIDGIGVRIRFMWDAHA